MGKFVECRRVICYNRIVTALILVTGRECAVMEVLLAFIISMLASVAGNYLCKWLDGDE